MPSPGLGLAVVFGRSLDLPHIQEPSQADIDAAHAMVRRRRILHLLLLYAILVCTPKQGHLCVTCSYSVLMQYVSEVESLWHEYKGRFGYGPDETLHVV